MSKKQRTIIHSEGRRIIANVYHFLKEEFNFTVLFRESNCNCDMSHLRNISQRTANATGVSLRTVISILKEERETPTPTSSKVHSPDKKRTKKDKRETDDDESSRLVAATVGRHNPIGEQCVVKRKGISTSSEMNDKFKLPTRYGAGEKSVWVEYIQLAAEYKPAVNLGQGFPDYHAPAHVTKALAEITMGENPLLNQYTRGFGHPRLVQNLSKVYSPLIGREIDPLNEILVTSGAYEALFSAIMGHVDEGDEVIVIEPFFDCYDFMIKSAGGKPRFIPLKPKSSSSQMTSADWVLDEKEFASLFNSKTKMLLLNTPHNPLGKVFTAQELQLIADLCKKHNVLCVSDEVYEWMVYEPNKHIRIASMPGMWERTITIGSAGKTFSVTGWKTGWAYGPAALMRNLQVVHQNCVYTCCTPIQEAVARSFEVELARFKSPECYFFSLARELVSKRDYLVKVLRENGFNPTVPDGGYFIVADWTQLEKKIDLQSESDKYKDYRFTKKFAKDAGVLTIPPSAFYSEEHKQLGENFARFCFIKKDENLALTEKLLKEWNAKK